MNVPGEPNLHADRAKIDQNFIALVSHLGWTTGTSDLNCLSYHSAKPEMYPSGLWNVRHVSDLLDSDAVDLLDEYVTSTPLVPLKDIHVVEHENPLRTG